MKFWTTLRTERGGKCIYNLYGGTATPHTWITQGDHQHTLELIAENYAYERFMIIRIHPKEGLRQVAMGYRRDGMVRWSREQRVREFLMPLLFRAFVILVVFYMILYVVGKWL